MSRPGLLTALALAGAAAALAPAAGLAQPNGNGRVHIGGQARIAFEDYQIDLPTGTTHRSLFSQAYTSSMSAPLLMPGLGVLNGAISAQTGDNLSRLDVGTPASEKRVGGTLSASIAPEQLGRIASLTPFISRMQYTASTGDPGKREYIEDTLGGTVGLAVPALPSVTFELQRVNRNQNGGSTEPGTRSLNTHGRGVYTRGPLRLDVDRQSRRTAVPGTNLVEYDQETLTSTANLEFPEIRRWGIQSVSTLGSYVGFADRLNAVADSRNLSLGTRITSQTLSVGGVGSFAVYGPSLRADLVQGRRDIGHDASVFSSVVRPRWNVANQVQFVNAPGRNVQPNLMAERVSGEAWTPDRRVGYRAQIDETFRWGSAAPDSMNDALSHRATWNPARKVDAFVENGFALSRQPGAGTITRASSVGGGLNWRPHPRVEGGPTVERSWIRDFAAGTHAIRDTLALGVRSSPVDRVTLNATARVELSESAGAVGSSNRYVNVGVDGSWRPVANCDLSARVVRYDRSFGSSGAVRDGAFETGASASYRLGRTSATVSWESRALTVPNSYRHLTASLTRSF